MHDLLRDPASRLYAILDLDIVESRGLSPAAVFDAWLSAGVRLIQLRAKRLASGPMLELAEALTARASSAGATFIVNDRADIATLASASGVHVGQDDLPPADARRIVGEAAIVGISTHNSAQVRAAAPEQVDYIAIGPVFSTSSKARPDPLIALDGVRAAKTIVESDRPLVGIGGITLERAPAVIEAGATAVAVIADLLADGLERRAREFLVALR